MPKILKTVYIDPGMDAQLKMIKSYTHVSEGAMIREAITQWLERRAQGKRTTVVEFDLKRPG